MSFESRDTDIVALPLSLLVRAVLRRRGVAEELLLQFEGDQVTISGAGLSELMNHILSARVQLLRVGQHDSCSIQALLVQSS